MTDRDTAYEPPSVEEIDVGGLPIDTSAGISIQPG